MIVYHGSSEIITNQIAFITQKAIDRALKFTYYIEV